MTSISRPQNSFWQQMMAALKPALKQFETDFARAAAPRLEQFEKDAAVAIEQALEKQYPELFKDAFQPTPAPGPVTVQPKPHRPTHPPAHHPAHHPAPHHPASHPAASTYGEPWKPGPGQLQGADTSHWQSDATFKKSVAGKQWTAIKATEATGYTDPSFRSRWNYLGQQIKQGKMTLRVAYHFMRPGNGVAQAKHFLGALGIKGKLPAGTRLALDWEASALKDPKALRDAANYIHKVTGLWPLVYTSASQVSRAKAAVPHAPLWEAKWSGSTPKNVPFVQYSDGPGYDHDVFNGGVAALRRFAGFKA